MTPHECDVIVVGGGPAGYTTALRAAEHGLRVALVERGDVGGTCLNVGCIPSKAVIHAAETRAALGGGAAATMGVGAQVGPVDLSATQRWKDGIVDRLRRGVEGLLARGSVDVIRGVGEVIDARTVRVATADGSRTVVAPWLVLASGSEPVELPHIPFGSGVLSSTDLLVLDRLPARLAVVGAGYIGVELGTAMAKLGSSVTIVEAEATILPLFDAALVRPVASRLDGLGIEVRTATRATGVDDGDLLVEGADGTTERVPADAVLVTVGRRPVTEGLGLARLGLPVAGPLVVDERCRTAAPGVFAIGDLTGEPMLAHRGIAQGELVADVIAGHDRTWDHLAVPAVCFSDPEVFSVGVSPDDARAAHQEVEVGTAAFRANGRALTLGDDAGFVRVVADAATGVVVGVQGVGPGASELAAPAALAVEMMATVDDVRATIIAHPTVSEALADAAAAVGRGASGRRAPEHSDATRPGSPP